MMLVGPRTKPADYLHQMKYRGPNEDFRECVNRIAFGLHDDNPHYHALREILLDMRFCPAGRIQAAIGTIRQVTPYNCFVSGTIADSFVDGAGSIMDRSKEAATTLRLGGGIGYDFSTLRPAGDRVTKLDTQASGPVGFLDLYNVLGDITAAVGHRRGAQMGILRVDHPDIESFVRVKQNQHKLRRFNLSIAVTDAFMQAALAGKEFDLTFAGRVYKTVDAAALWELIMRSTWDWGEPGVWFVDRVNSMNNLYYCETIAACNPCGEQPLPPFGACLLGSFNLVKYLRSSPPVSLTSIEQLTDPPGKYYFDFDQLAEDIPYIVRAMDNVIDRAKYPLAEQKAQAVTKRRMGLGVMGLANAGEACGYAYGTKEFLEFEDKIFHALERGAYLASINLAKQKGSFPLFDAERYLNSGYMKTVDSDIREQIERYGIRNSHLTSNAPTGTISLCADNISSGLEPVFSYALKRPVETPDGVVEYDIKDYGAEFLGTNGKLARDVTADEHISVLATAQKHIDSAVSKTVNMDSSMPWEAFKALYQRAWELGCKSCTTFNETGMRAGLLQAEKPAVEQDAGEACFIMADGSRSCE